MGAPRANLAARYVSELASTHHFTLLRARRFAALFWVQFLGAANDNVFKFAFGEPVPPEIATPELLMQKVQQLLLRTTLKDETRSST